MAAIEPPPQATRSDLLGAALAYARQGWHVFPLHSPGRATPCDCGDAACAPVAKHPWISGGFRAASTDERIVRQWWRKWPRANVGIACGASGLIVLDVDPYHGGELALIELVQRHAGAAHGALTPAVEALTATLTSETGGGGEHYIYRAPAGVSIRNTTDLDEIRGLDVRGDGGYLVAAPSLHVSGARYQWREGVSEPGALPDWLIPVLTKRGSRSLRQPVRMFQPSRDVAETGAYWLGRALGLAHEGNRNDKGFWLACQLRDANLSDQHAESVMVDYASRVPGRGYSEREALQSLRSAYRTGPRDAARSLSVSSAPAASYSPSARSTAPAAQVAIPAPAYRVADPAPAPPPPLSPPPPPPTSEEPPTDEAPQDAAHRTDMGNARRFVTQFGRDARYVAVWKRWLVWDGRRWLRDETDAAIRKAKETVRGIYAEAARCEDDVERKELVKWGLRSEADSRVRAMLSQAESEPELAMSPTDFDRHPWLLNVENGVIDLRTGDLRPHSREDYLTQLAPARYDPAATLPRWDSFIATVTGGDEALAAFLRRAVGYTLTGATTEEKLFFLHGPTRTGKSTFIEAIKATIGEYARTADFETFLKKTATGGPRDDIADLAGSRLVCSVEVDDGKKLAEGLVKTITGGDAIKARHLYSHAFTFLPQFKLWLAANHEPRVDASDGAMWSRILRIPFNHTPERRDPALKVALRDPSIAGPAILAWAVRGCLEWQRDGLGVPAAVEAATEEYRANMDPLAGFLEERCVIGPQCVVPVAVLYQAYQSWAQQNGDRYPISQHRFKAHIEAQWRNTSGSESGIAYNVLRRVNGVPTRCCTGIGLHASEGGVT